MHLSAAEKIMASIRLLQIGLTKARKMIFLSKPPHIPIDILYSSADSWRLQFWLIHFPFIINTTSLPWRFRQSLWQVLDLDRKTFILWWPLDVQERKLVLFSKSPWALLKRAHLWVHVFQQAQGCFVFLFHRRGQWGRGSRCTVNPKHDRHLVKSHFKVHGEAAPDRGLHDRVRPESRAVCLQLRPYIRQGKPEIAD